MASAAATSTSSTSFHNPLPSFFTTTQRSHAPPRSVTFRRHLRPISAVYSTADAGVSTIAGQDPAKMVSYYEVLGIHDFATRKEVKDAYRRMARIVHPDANGSSSSSSNGQKDATSCGNDQFIRVHQAYVTLSDPNTRADYDRMLLCKRRRIRYSSPNQAFSTSNKYGATSCSTGFSGYTRRTWETDQCW